MGIIHKLTFNSILFIECQNITRLTALYRVLNIQREPMSNRGEEKLPRTGDTYRKEPRADPRLEGLTHLPRVSYRAVRFVYMINE